MKTLRSVSFVSLMVVCTMCNRAPVATPEDLASAPPPDTATLPPDMAQNRGRCFNDGKHIACLDNEVCGAAAPGLTCQEGMCCPEPIDPKSCTCPCNGGRECMAGEACCVGGKGRNLPDEGVLKCRLDWQCRDIGP